MLANKRCIKHIKQDSGTTNTDHFRQTFINRMCADVIVHRSFCHYLELLDLRNRCSILATELACEEQKS